MSFVFVFESKIYQLMTLFCLITREQIYILRLSPDPGLSTCYQPFCNSGHVHIVRAAPGLPALFEFLINYPDSLIPTRSPFRYEIPSRNIDQHWSGFSEHYGNER